MENKLKKQRYWVLMSSTKTPVLSSLIARTKRPTKGEWQEVHLSPCCKLKAAVGTYQNYPYFTLTCGTKTTSTVPFNAETLEEAIDYLNQHYFTFGTWSTDGTYFYLTGSICPNGTLEVAYD